MKLFLVFILLFFAGQPALAQEMPGPGQAPPARQQPAAAMPSAPTPGAPPEGERAAATEATPVTKPVMEIKPVEGQEGIYSFELRDADIGDLFRVLAHNYKLNMLIGKDVTGTITASLSSVSLEEALEAIADLQGLALEKKGNIVKVSPNLISKIFSLKYIEAKKILEPSTSSTSTESSSTSSTTSSATSSTTGAITSGTAGAGSSSTTTQESTIYDLLSDKGKVLLGKYPNSIMVIDYPQYVQKVEDYLLMIDRKMTQRVFRLRFMKAADVVGEVSTTTSSTTSTEAEASSTTSTEASTEASTE